METLACCQSEPNELMRANSANSRIYFSCVPHCGLKAHPEKVLLEDRFFFGKASCFRDAARGVCEGEDGGGARLAGSCSPAAARSAGKRIRGPLRRRIPCLHPGCQHRAVGWPGRMAARDPPATCSVRSLHCPGVCDLSFTPLSAGARCTSAGKHKGDSTLKTHPDSLASTHTLSCCRSNQPCFSLFLQGPMCGARCAFPWLPRIGAVLKGAHVGRGQQTQGRFRELHAVRASCKSRSDLSFTSAINNSFSPALSSLKSLLHLVRAGNGKQELLSDLRVFWLYEVLITLATLESLKTVQLSS